MKETRPNVIIIGGGPAGLTAAFELAERGGAGVLLEKDAQVGGIARTVEREGYRFDLGGHRFFTKVDEVDEIWHRVAGDEMLLRQRLSRIYYLNRFFYYPLRPWNTLRGLGPLRAARALASYARARAFPRKSEESLEDWVVNRFGYYLYRAFFKTYTEKVWGVPCTEIRAEWAAQRIKGLSLVSAVINAFLGQRRKSKKEKIKTLIEEFEYPRFGPGQLWEMFRDYVEAKGIPVLTGHEAVRIHWHPGTGATGVTARNGSVEKLFVGSHVISSMPIRDLVACLDPPAPPEVRDAAAGLRYRDFLTVALVVDAPDLFPDNWIYVHSPEVRLGRVQNFKNWSPYMVPDPSKTCLGLEYFCFEGDDLWNASDEDLIELGKRELAKLKLVDPSKVIKGWVVRVRKAYPMYDSEYRARVERVRAWMEAKVPNLFMVGRNGMHKYNNQDHSMLTALLAVRNIYGAKHDIWAVNTEQEYHEEKRESL